jgi:hypothetical protein
MNIFSLFKNWKKRHSLRYAEKLIEVKALIESAKTYKDGINVFNELMILSWLSENPEEVQKLIKDIVKMFEN